MRAISICSAGAGYGTPLPSLAAVTQGDNETSKVAPGVDPDQHGGSGPPAELAARRQCHAAHRHESGIADGLCPFIRYTRTTSNLSLMARSMVSKASKP